MLTIIHGDDTERSRKYFGDLKDKDSVSYDATDLEINSFTQALQGTGLFGGGKVFIDNLFSRKASKNYDVVLETLKTSQNSEVYIYSDKPLSSSILKAFPKHNAQLFKIPATIWAFLDGIRPGNSANVSSFHNTLTTNEAEITFAMIIRQFRLMLGLITEEKIDEIVRLAPWQRGKIQRQASLFGLENLRKAYKKLYLIDKEQKTGRSSLSLVQSIDIFLLEI